ncbi:MAG TPA: glutaredoxin family protein [Tepidisphaeraceae bacterium]|jgi:glutaredoxin|nr:glutaredoxin family protein [Tepidisphaeraceae bacterium]
MTQVILYSKPDCHLCEPVRELILAVQKERPFEFSIRNIEDDPADFEKYKHAIPVVLVHGREIARYKMSRRQLEQALATEQT